MGGSKKQTIGYKYSMDMHMALCHGPIDALTRIRFDGRTAWRGQKVSGAIQVNSPELFGGKKREGGVSGQVDLEPGAPDQEANSYLQSILPGGMVPAFRGITALVFRQFYVGNNPYVKAPDFRVQRIQKKASGEDQWNNAEAPIGDFEVNEAAIYFALDKSGSMSGSRLSNMQAAISDVLDFIQDRALDTGLRVDIRVVGWSDDASGLTKRNVDADGYAELKTYVNNLSASGFTNFIFGVQGASEFFESSPKNLRRLLFFVTDGVPNPSEGTSDSERLANAIAASVLLGGVSNLEVYGIHIEEPVTFYTEFLDNTDIDGVPNVEDGDPQPLIDAIKIGFGGHFDMNPIHVIRECLTDQDWGMGYQDDDIDEASFEAASATIFEEEMGVSLLWDRQISIEDFVQEVLKHISATLYVSRTTGKFVIKLARDDYSESDLVELNPSNVESIQNYRQPSTDELVNQVTVNYWDQATSTDASVTVQDIALVQMHGSIIGTTNDYPGFTNRRNATLAAQRDLKALSTPLVSCTITANLDAVDLNPGDVFKLVWPDYDLAGLVMRVIKIGFGDGRQNRVRIDAVQDVFAVPEIAVVAQPPTDWVDPVGSAQPIEDRIVQEAPYYELVRQRGLDVVDALMDERPEAGFLMATAARPSTDSINATLSVDAGNGYDDSATVDFPPSADLAEDMPQAEESTVAITDGDDLDEAEVGQIAQIGTEIVKILAVSDESVTLGRGCLDTVPQNHSSGDRLIIWDQYAASDDVEYADSDEIDVKLLTNTGADSLASDAAPVDEVEFDQRAYRPYPPGNLKANTVFYPPYIDGEDELALTWAHRDRLQQTGEDIIEFDAGDIGPEDGTTYTLRIYGEEDDLLRTVSSISGTSYTYNDADELDDSQIPAEGDIPLNPGISTTSLRAHWKFDEGTGTATEDAHSTFDGTLTNSALWTASGKLSNALQASSTHYVTLGTANNLLNITANFSCYYWAYIANSADDIFVLDLGMRSGAANGDNTGLSFHIEDGQVIYRVRQSLATGYGGQLRGQWGTGLNLKTGEYNLVICTRSNTGADAYLYNSDGVFSASMTFGGSFSLSTWENRTNNILARATNLADTITGNSTAGTRLDELGIFARVITSDERDNLWNDGAGIAYPFDPIFAEGLRLNGRLRFELESVRDSLTSRQFHNQTVSRIGWNFNWDQFWSL